MVDNKTFVDHLPYVVEVLLKDIEGMPESCADELRKYYKHCIEYTVQGGKMTRGLTVAKAALFCAPEDKKNDDAYLKKALSVGWAVELLQGFFLIADDVMDSSSVRRGQPCWYKLPNVTYVNAINDSLFVESCCYALLDAEFEDKPEMLMTLRKILSFVSRKTVLGQHLDTNTRLPGTKIDFSRYTAERYEAIITHKTAYYTYYLPAKLGLALAGCDKEDEEIVHEVCMQLGRYFQSQDDVLDAFADPEVIGKVGTDVEEGKLTWLLHNALAVASDEQKAILFEHVGMPEMDGVLKVKAVYRELQLEEKFAKWEDETAEEIKQKIEKCTCQGVKDTLNFLLEKTYKRRK